MDESEQSSAATRDDIASFEEAHAFREGLGWWRDNFGFNTETEAAQPTLAPSATPISDLAFSEIVFFEVTNQQTYERKYSKPTWPEGASGVTIGIGYDVGYSHPRQLRTDWQGQIPNEMIDALIPAIGVTGLTAKQLAKQLAASVAVNWNAAMSVHRTRVIPRWTALVERSLQNTNALPADCLGALVSLTYNRGASFSKDGDRYREMRAIKGHMAARTFSHIPDEIRSMKRLWPDVFGLRLRRDREAALFATGLSSIAGG